MNYEVTVWYWTISALGAVPTAQMWTVKEADFEVNSVGVVVTERDINGRVSCIENFHNPIRIRVTPLYDKD